MHCTFIANDIMFSVGNSHVKLSFSCIKDLKAKHPNKDWAQLRGRLLGICNMTTEETSINDAVNKVGLATV